MTVERTTQVVVEAVTDATPAMRVTQVVIETISTNVADDPSAPPSSGANTVVIICT